MRGQGSPGPGITHSQGDMAHYDSPLCWRGGTGKAEWGREYEEGSKHTPNGENGDYPPFLRSTPAWSDFPWFLQILSLGAARWHENNDSSLCGTPICRPEAHLMGPVLARWFKQKIVSSTSRQQSLTDATDVLTHTPASFLTVFSLWPLLFITDKSLSSPSFSPKCVNHRLSNTSKYLLMSCFYRNCSG